MSAPLRVAAVFRHHRPLTQQPDDLRALLAGLTGHSFRRIGRYIELALLGAVQCAQRHGSVAPDCAIYMTSDAPMLTDCVKAVRNTVVEQRVPTPFEFMNISGNMAGFYVAQQLHTSGPQLALHRKGAAVEAALELLQLRSAPHRRCLVGYVEEGLWPPDEQRVRLGLSSEAELHECSLWIYLDADCAQPLALLEAPRRHASRDEAVAAARTAGLPVLLGGLADDEDAQAFGAPPPRASPDALARGSGSLAAAVIGFAEAAAAAPLLHLSRAADGGYHAVEIAPL